MPRIDVARCTDFLSLKSSRFGLDVWVDGQRKTYLSKYGGNSVLLELTPGRHTLQVKAGMLITIESRVKEFEIKEGETLFFQAQNNPKRVLLVLAVVAASVFVIFALSAFMRNTNMDAMYILIFGAAIATSLINRQDALVIVETDRRGYELE